MTETEALTKQFDANHTDQVFDLGVVATSTTWNPSPKNNTARDGMVEVLRRAVDAAKAAPAPPG